MSLGNLAVETAVAGAVIENDALQRMQRRAALWTVLVPTAGFAIGAGLAIAGRVSAPAVVAWAVMHLATMLGITVGFHRWGAHRSFRPVEAVKVALVVLGSMAAQGPAVHWVSNHRRHHQFSDEPGDPHTPNGHGDSAAGRLRGFWHAHVGWMFEAEVTNPVRYSKDLLRDKTLMALNRLYPVWVAAGVLLPGIALGLLERSWAAAGEGVLWGGLVRIFTVHHATWSINSITHLWGRRPFASRDESRNVAWLALPSAGESWHNGHHGFPSSARFGLAWWEVDLGWVLIRLLQGVGAVSDINTPSAAAMRKAHFEARRTSCVPKKK